MTSASPRLERILYSSLVDVALPYGPGVNELGFLKDLMGRLGDRLLAVLPRPSRPLPLELETLNVRFIPNRYSVRHLRGWAGSRILGSLVLPRAIDRFDPDLVVIRPGAFSFPHLVASRRTLVPYVLKTAGDASFRGYFERYAAARPFRGLNQAIYGSLVRGSACTDVVSEAQSQLLMRLNPGLESPVYVIDNGVDLNHFWPRDGRDERARFGFGEADLVVGYVGNFPMRRGGKEVIDIVADLSGPTRSLMGLIVGDGGEAGLCRAYARDRHVSDSVIIYGQADYADVPVLMACMDIGVSMLRPEERGASEQKVRQYLAMGLCVVGTSGSNDFLREHDFARVIETLEPPEIEEAVASLVQHGKEQLVNLGRSARAFAESSLSLERRNDERIRLWEEVLYSRIQR